MWLLTSALGRKLLGGAVALSLLLGASLYIYNKGKAAGNADGQRAQLETDRQQFEQDRKQFLDQLAQYRAENDRLNQKLSAQDTAIQTIQTDRAAIRKAVSQLTPPQVNAELSAIDPKELLQMVRDYPKLSDELKATQDKVSTLEAKVENEQKRADAAMEAYNKLLPLYVKAYGAAQKHHSKFVKIITLGLVRDRKIDLPDPVTLVHP